MKWLTLRPWLGTVVRLVLGAVWIWAASSKLSSPREFVQAVRAYDVTPEWLAKAIGYGLPVLELGIGIVLVLGITVRIAAMVSGVLFAFFLIGIIQAAARGIQLECGCFGGGGTTSGGTNYTWDILRDIGLVALAAFLVVWPSTRISLDEFISRNDRVEQPSAKRLRSDQGRRKYNALLEARRKEAQSRDRWIGASLAAVIVLVSLIGIGVQSGRAKIEGSLTATNASVDNGIVYGKKAAATIDVYEDFQCPNCRDYEQTVGPTMRKLVQENKAQVKYHIISLSSLDTDANDFYSSRGANAGYCASDVSVDYFAQFHEYMYSKVNGKEVQPEEGSGGISNETIIADAKKAGTLTSVQATNFSGCVDTEKHKALVQAITDRASQDGVNGTPTIKVNGKQIDNSVAALTKAVDAALKNGPAPDPSPTPSKTVAPSTTATPPKSATSKSTPAKAASSTAAP